MLSLIIHELGEMIVFRCTGRIVFRECDILRHAVFSRPYVGMAVLDLAEVTAMDAAGLGLLVALRNWASAKRIPLKLLNLTPQMANLFNITHLTAILDVCSVRDTMDLLGMANQSSLATGYAATSTAGVTDMSLRGFKERDEVERQFDEGFYEALKAS
jgi:anti-anti-sigma factor